MIITRREKSTHWYTPDGKACHEVPKADGSGLRATTIRDAVKLGLYRSVTNVIGILAKPGLVEWQKEQCILSALTLPRKEEETLHDFAHRAMADSEQQSIDARDDGSYYHDLAAEFLTRAAIPVGLKDREILGPFMEWAVNNVRRLIYSEKVVVNHQLAYAGRLDAFVELVDGSYAVLDLKTQEMGEDKSGVPKAAYWPEWPLQLAAYAQCEALQFWTPANHRLISVVLNRTKPGFGVKEWPPSADHFATFSRLCWAWSYFKHCTPGLKEAA